MVVFIRFLNFMYVWVYVRLQITSSDCLAFSISLKDPYGKKSIENGLGPVNIVETGGMLVFF